LGWGRVFLVATLAAVLAACGASGAASPVPIAPSTEASSAATAAPKASANPATTAGMSLASTDSPRSPNPAPTPGPIPDPTPVPVPPKPSGVSFDERREGDDPPSTEITQTVRWAAPRSAGVEIRVYGVTECIAKPAKPSPDTHGPCLVEHTPLPASVRKLLATAPASEGVASWTWTGTFDCEIGLAYDPRGPAYHAVVLAAYSTSDHSIFAIAEPGMWWEPGSNDIVC
jgi:hypothetical protein